MISPWSKANIYIFGALYQIVHPQKEFQVKLWTASLSTATEEDRDGWIKCVQESIRDNPFHRIIAGCLSKLVFWYHLVIPIPLQRRKQQYDVEVVKGHRQKLSNKSAHQKYRQQCRPTQRHLQQCLVIQIHLHHSSWCSYNWQRTFRAGLKPWIENLSSGKVDNEVQTPICSATKKEFFILDFTNKPHALSIFSDKGSPQGVFANIYASQTSRIAL